MLRNYNVTLNFGRCLQQRCLQQNVLFLCATCQWQSEIGGCDSIAHLVKFTDHSGKLARVILQRI